MDENIANKILSKDIENIVKKAASGKPLSNAERLRIETEYADRSGDLRYAKNIVELAEILEVSRQSIHHWRKMIGAPKPSRNGKHNVPKWREFVRKNHLKEPDSPEEIELKSRKLLAEVKQAELKLHEMESKYVSMEEVRKVWNAHAKLVHDTFKERFWGELPQLLTTLDAIGIREKMRDVLDEAYAAIAASCDSIEDTSEEQ